jgi:hypothetical protein
VRAAALLMVSLIASCDSSDQEALHGHLYFAAGNYVGQFDLRDSGSAPVANLGDITIDNVSPFIGDDLLLTIREYVNGRELSRILRFDPRRNVSSPLFPGMIAEYLPSSMAVIYDDGLRLMATHRKKAYRDETVIDVHGHNSRPAVVVLSEAEILFDSVRNDNVLIQRYNVDTDTSEPLHALSKVCVLNGAVWIAESKQLLCRSHAAGTKKSGYVFVSLDGTIEGTLLLDSDKNFRALAYLPDQGTVIFTERSYRWGDGQPRHAVWAYDMHTASSYRLAKDQYLGNSVVYRR